MEIRQKYPNWSDVPKQICVTELPLDLGLLEKVKKLTKLTQYPEKQYWTTDGYQMVYHAQSENYFYLGLSVDQAIRETKLIRKSFNFEI